MTYPLEQPNGNPKLLRGIQLFNAQDFFECHEVLEEAWREETGYWRDFYQGLIKVAVAFYHAERGNFEGACKVLRSGLPQLESYRETCVFIQLERLIDELQKCLLDFERLKREPAKFDLAKIPLIH